MWMRRKRRRAVPGLNMTATADISFMLLAFFLMVSSMDVDKGLPVLLPAAEQTHDVRDIEIAESNVLRITADAADTLRCNGTVADRRQLKSAVKTFVAGATDEHIILISTDRATSYDTYFHIQRIIAEAYLDLRNAYAREQFGCDYRACDEGQRVAVEQRYPWRVSEAEQTDGPATAAGTSEKGGGR